MFNKQRTWLGPNMHRTNTVLCSPAQLLQKLGNPSCDLKEWSADGKVDCEFYFQDNQDWIALWAYKATNLYSEDNPSPESFWQSQEEFEFSVYASSFRGFEQFCQQFNLTTSDKLQF